MRYVMISLLVLAACDRGSGGAPGSGAGRAKWSPAGKRWAEELTRVLPEMMCTEKMYFASCFKVSQDECQRVMRTETDRCFDQHADVVPQVVDAVSGSEAGRQIGQCAGAAAEGVLRARGLFKDTPLCSDMDHWARVVQDAAQDVTTKPKH